MRIHVTSLTFGSLVSCVTLVPLNLIDKSLTLVPTHASSLVSNHTPKDTSYMTFIPITSLHLVTLSSMKTISHYFLIIKPHPPFISNPDKFDSPIQPIVNPSSPHTTNPSLRRSTRPKQAPTYLQDYHRALTSQVDTTASNVRYPLHSILSYSRLSPSH